MESPTARYLVEKYATLLLGIGLHILGYLALNQLFSPVSWYEPVVGLDRAIRFDVRWAVVYDMHIFVPVVVAITSTTIPEIRRAAASILALDLFLVPLFVLVPVSFPREPVAALVDPGGSASEWLLSLAWFLDAPGTCFPSDHVATSVCCALVALRLNRRWGVFALVLSGLIAASTLYVKQHYLVDVVAGGLVAWLAVWLVHDSRLSARVAWLHGDDADV